MNPQDPLFSTAIRSLVLAAAVVSLSTSHLRAWEGHDWNRWRETTTWTKPELPTAQAGKRELVPLLAAAPTNSAGSTANGETLRNEMSSTIQTILGAPAKMKKPPLEVRDLGRVESPGYSRRHLLIRSEGEDWIPAYLLMPEGIGTNRRPAMICLHQTVAQGKEEPCGIEGDPELAFAVELVQRGFVCIAPDVIGFGERIPVGKQPYHDSIAFYKRHPGWSFMGKMIWDIGRVIDYLETLPEVDARAIGSIGHSHGAYGTLFAAAFEPRIAAAVASCGFTTFRRDPQPERWSHLTALIPQLGFYLPDVAAIPFDWHHVLGLIAPRPLFVWYATRDSIFPNTENLQDLLKDVAGVYRLHGAEPSLVWQAFDGPHTFPRGGREAAYRWLESSLSAASGVPPLKRRSAFFPRELVEQARANATNHEWAAAIRDSLVAAAEPWRKMSDEELWGLMFGNTVRRAWHVWSNGHCPSCKKPVPMYEWTPEALNRPWKMRCPQCNEWFPKNDFLKFYRSGLNEEGVFDPQRADRSLLFNAEHPVPSDPLHRFGVDDGEGYAEGSNRWRFIGAYLIYGQWKQAIVNGIRNLAAAYVATGDRVYAHKAAVLLDRVADLYPTFDFGKEGVMYEGPPRAGYVSTWHDACVEAHDLALAYDSIFEALTDDPDLVSFLSAKAARYRTARSKFCLTDIRRNIEERILRDTLDHRPKIESNYPSTDVTMIALRTVLGWPDERAEIMGLLDSIVMRATAVDGLTGEKGTAGYAVIAPHGLAELLGRYARSDGAFIRDMVRRHPRLHAMYRFHLDTWCLGQYYPRSGDTGAFAERTTRYAGVSLTRNPGVNPSSWAFLWELYKATGDPDFVRLVYSENDNSTAGLPYDLFASDPDQLQAEVAQVISEKGADIVLPSVNKTEWCLAILRSGARTNARAAWLDYDSGERHGHADAMTIGLFAKGYDLLPDFGYPPVQYGGWGAPRSVWYTQTAAHNTVSVDRGNTKGGSGKSTLWFEGRQFGVVRAAAPALAGVQQYERTVILADISEQDSYLVDVFRVAGGAEHARFFHGHFGEVSTSGLRPTAVEEKGFGEMMRGFKRDTAPAEGWSADWRIRDHLKLGSTSQVHLRLTDFTRGAEVLTGETWVSVGRFGGTADAWIPSVLVRRAGKAPLASTFVGVLEPYERESHLASIRRLPLEDGQARELSEGYVCLDIPLADGRRDLLLSANTEPPDWNSPQKVKTLRMIQNAGGVRFDGDLCLIRYSPQGRPARVLFCGGRELVTRDLVVRAKDPGPSFELDLLNPAGPIASGPADALELVEVQGTRLWPK